MKYLHNAVAGICWAQFSITQGAAAELPWSIYKFYTTLVTLWIQYDTLLKEVLSIVKSEVATSKSFPTVFWINWSTYWQPNAARYCCSASYIWKKDATKIKDSFASTLETVIILWRIALVPSGSEKISTKFHKKTGFMRGQLSLNSVLLLNLISNRNVANENMIPSPPVGMMKKSCTSSWKINWWAKHFHEELYRAFWWRK